MTLNTSVRSMKRGIVLKTAEGDLLGKTPTFHDLQSMAQAAESVGLDPIWLCDHLISRFPGREERGLWEAFTVLSALAASITEDRAESPVHLWGG